MDLIKAAEIHIVNEPQEEVSVVKNKKDQHFYNTIFSEYEDNDFLKSQVHDSLKQAGYKYVGHSINISCANCAHSRSGAGLHCSLYNKSVKSHFSCDSLEKINK